jgi:Raf kinase inhibitor-like YbhB/YbcL family protein
MNDFGRHGYGGPMPPKGHGQHRYFFKLFALDVASLGLPADSRRAAADHALQGHVLAAAQYMGRFERR